MTSKRRRSRSRSGGGSSANTREERTETSKDSGQREKDRGEPARTARGAAESPFPTLSVSLARGLRAVGSSPTILAVASLSLLATWASYVVLGAEPGPRTLSLLVAAPPVHVFTDAPVALAPGSSAAYWVAAVSGLTALRGITFALLALLIVQALREGRTSLAAAARALPRTATVMGALYVIQFGLVVAALQLLLGFLQQLAILSIVAGLYFLAFAPVVAAAESAGPRQALRRGFRAARLPGTRHISLVAAYFLVLFYSGAVAPFGVLAPATPTMGAWAYGLFATFIHVSVMAAFAYRWLEVREEVPAAAPATGKG